MIFHVACGLRSGTGVLIVAFVASARHRSLHLYAMRRKDVIARWCIGLPRPYICGGPLHGARDERMRNHWDSFVDGCQPRKRERPPPADSHASEVQ